jgi:hypothetical protein
MATRSRLIHHASSVMQRALLLGLVGLLAGCFIPTPNPPNAAVLKPLQNPKYPGDANKDLVPYQARERDAADCSPSSQQVPRELTGFFECMAARGWRRAE